MKQVLFPKDGEFWYEIAALVWRHRLRRSGLR